MSAPLAKRWLTCGYGWLATKQSVHSGDSSHGRSKKGERWQVSMDRGQAYPFPNSGENYRSRHNSQP